MLWGSPMCSSVSRIWGCWAWRTMGIALLLITYLVVKYVDFGIYLPISATMAIIALPLMAIIFIKK